MKQTVRAERHPRSPIAKLWNIRLQLEHSALPRQRTMYDNETKLIPQQTYLRRKHAREDWDPGIWESPCNHCPNATGFTGTLVNGKSWYCSGTICATTNHATMTTPTSYPTHRETMGDQSLSWIPYAHPGVCQNVYLLRFIFEPPFEALTYSMSASLIKKKAFE